jgi:hypothetical protein
LGTGKDHKGAVNQLFLWSAFYTMVVGKYHHITAPLAAASPEVQDQVIQEVVDAYRRGEFAKGSFFEHVLSDVLQKFNLGLSPEMFATLVAEAVRNRPRKKGASTPAK